MNILLSLVSVASLALAQSSCSSPSPSNGIRPSVASGYSLQVVATGLADPRGIYLDDAGHLLVVESGAGRISAHTLVDNGGCVTVSNSSFVTDELNLNHGIEMSSDGRILYASSANDAYSWEYDSSSMTVSNQVTLVSDMAGRSHGTRTLLLSRKEPNTLVIVRGSNANLDPLSVNVDDGYSQVRAFQLRDRGSDVYNYAEDGRILGWGLRNEVGIVEHPDTGGIWGVENSADEIHRNGVDVSNDNPGEELNFLGYLNETAGGDPPNYGYPWCLAAWAPNDLPDNGNFTVGSQFAFDASSSLDNQNRTDAYCAEQVAPRLVFQAHMAPLDIKFNDSGREAWITFHGSWDRNDPVGYKLSVVRFENGEPVEPSTSTTAATDIIANEDLSRCPDNCMRPVGMAFDSQGRIFMSSDSTGEIYLVTRTSAATNNSSSSGSSSNSAPASLTWQPSVGKAAILGAIAYLLL